MQPLVTESESQGFLVQVCTILALLFFKEGLTGIFIHIYSHISSLIRHYTWCRFTYFAKVHTVV